MEKTSSKCPFLGSMLIFGGCKHQKMSFEKKHFNAVGFLSLLLLTDLQRLHGTIRKVHKALSVFFSWEMCRLFLHLTALNTQSGTQKWRCFKIDGKHILQRTVWLQSFHSFGMFQWFSHEVLQLFSVDAYPPYQLTTGATTKRGSFPATRRPFPWCWKPWGIQSLAIDRKRTTRNSACLLVKN